MKILAAILLALSTAAVAAPKNPALGKYEIYCPSGKDPNIMPGGDYHPSVVSKQSNTKYTGFMDGQFNMAPIPYQKVGTALCMERKEDDGYGIYPPEICLRSNTPPNVLTKNAAYVLAETAEPVCREIGDRIICTSDIKRFSYLCDVIRRPLAASQK